MKALSDIKRDLINSLESQESGAWAQVSQSLVGKELIAFGAEVIAASYNVVDALVKSFDYKSADERALISMSHVYEIPVSFVSPAFIRLKLTNKAGLSFKPFELTYSVGNVKFTNISFFKGGDDITLYQGVVKSSKSSSVDLTDFKYDKEVPFNKMSIPTGTEELMTGINIGSAMPESVYVFYSDEGKRGSVSKFNPIMSGENTIAYKIYTLMNKDQMVQTGDGIWGKRMPKSELQVIWLEPTALNFALNGKLTSPKGELNFTVIGSGAAKEKSLNYARDAFRRHLLELNAVVSKEQIKDYVNSFAYVEDCSVTALNDVVTIYVKPTDPSDSGEFGSLQSILDIKGGLFTSHIIKKGTPIQFRFGIETSSDSVQRSQIEEYLKQEFGYHSTGFNKQVDCNEVAASIFKMFGTYSRVTFVVVNTMTPSGHKLQFIPSAGTMKLINSLGKVVGYDLNGQLFCEEDSGSGNLPLPSGLNVNIGGFNINYSANSLDSFSEEYIKRYPSTAITQIFNKLSNSIEGIKACTHNGHVYIYKNDETYGSKLCVYTVDQITPQGLMSSIVPVSGANPKTIIALDETKTIPLYINGSFYCINHDVSTGELQLQFFSGVSYAPYFSINIPSVNTNILGVYIQNNSIFIVCEDNNVVVINDFNTSYIGWISSRLISPDEDKIIVGFHAYTQDRCALLLSDGSVWTVSGMNINENNVEFQDKQKLASIGSLPQGKRFIYCSEDYVWVGNIGNNSSGHISSVIDNDGNVYNQIDSVYPLYLSSTKPIGTINYMDGEITYSDSQMTGLTYKSTLVNLDERSYLKLDDSTPVVWN